MDTRLLLLIFIYFTCKTQTKAPDAPPKVSVFPSEISAGTDSVTLYCYPPPSIIVSQCYFSIEEGESIRSSTCRKTLTGTELLAKAGQSSLSEVKVKCFYKVRQGEEELQSSHSNPASIFIQDLPSKLTVCPRVISAETDTVTLYCHSPTSTPCYFVIDEESIQSSSCQKTLTVTELLAKKGQSSPAKVEVKCFYTVKRGELYSPSQHSNTLSIHIQTSAPKLTVNTQNISVTESVTLWCQPPPPVSTSQCYFYTVKGGSPTLLSCVETLTGSELLLMSQQSSPAEVEVKCFYTVKLGHLDYPSAGSDAQVMMIQTFVLDMNATSEASQTELLKWKLIVGVTCFGVTIGILCLGWILPGTDKCFDQRGRKKGATLGADMLTQSIVIYKCFDQRLNKEVATLGRDTLEQSIVIFKDSGNDDNSCMQNIGRTNQVLTIAE